MCCQSLYETIYMYADIRKMYERMCFSKVYGVIDPLPAGFELVLANCVSEAHNLYVQHSKR